MLLCYFCQTPGRQAHYVNIDVNAPDKKTTKTSAGVEQQGCTYAAPWTPCFHDCRRLMWALDLTIVQVHNLVTGHIWNKANWFWLKSLTLKFNICSNNNCYIVSLLRWQHVTARTESLWATSLLEILPLSLLNFFCEDFVAVKDNRRTGWQSW